MFRPALIEALRSGYRRQDLVADVLAGCLVGVVALPLSMGLAIASGVPPAVGLVTAVVGGFLISALGGSRVQIGGPAGAFVGLCAAGVSDFGYGGLALATLMAGALIVLLGVARLGKAITFIPTPVVIGFTTGIAVIIASTQLAPLAGIVEPDKPLAHVTDRLAYLWAHRQEFLLEPCLVCVVTMGLIFGCRRWLPRVPGALVAVVAVVGVTLAVTAFGLDKNLATIGSRYGDIPHGLPWPGLPDIGLKDGWSINDLLHRIREVSGLALTIALLGSIESLLSAVVADGMTGQRHHSNTELIAQGLANLVTPLFGGLPCTGAIARTSTNIKAGARTPVAGMVHALAVLLIMLVLAPMVVHIPLACLAGVLLMVCWFMAELRHWPHILKAERSDAFLLPISFGLTVFIDLTTAVTVGVLLAMFFFVRRMADSTRVEAVGEHTEAWVHGPLPVGVQIYEIRGPFFFGAATLLRDLDTSEGGKALILRLGNVPFIDVTAAFAVKELAESCRAKGSRLILCEVKGQAWRDLSRHGLDAAVGPGGIQADLAGALGNVRMTGNA